MQFLGATQTVTGSRFLLDTGRSRVLFDCGVFQGEKALRLRNWEPFPIPPSHIDALVVSHAHLDHVGFVPALVRGGFSGRVHSTKGTYELARIVLTDSARIQEEDAAYANRAGFSKHHPALPLYTEDDATESLQRFTTHAFGQRVQVTQDVTVEFRRSGHILGSSWVLIHVEGFEPIAFSGDLGRPNHPLLLPPEPLVAVESLLIESTYGNRTHDSVDPLVVLGDTISRTASRGGSVIIPSFAVDRTEVVLMHLRRLRQTGVIPDLPIFVDSPMALEALNVYRRAVSEGWAELRPNRTEADDPFGLAGVTEVRTVEDSKSLNDIHYPSIIIAGSGMATGGRVLHHLKYRLPDNRNTVVLAGFQVPGSRGRQLLDGVHELKMFGEYVDVRAEVVNVPGLSVHADRDELAEWIDTAPTPPRTTFVIHGDIEASDALCHTIRETRGSRAVVPKPGEIVFITR